ncbi:MAG: hypothetical protein HY072_10400 [Deltaproteobacteria bacterium]|nr:hypothetical protein [Deltaproteobacteria bacterium]
MSADKDTSQSIDAEDQTPVDAGEDLLNKTRTKITTQITSDNQGDSELVQEAELFITAETVDDNLHSAKILIQEGILEEAKKILRKIIRFDCHNVTAKQLLEELEAQEIKNILQVESIKKTTPAEFSAKDYNTLEVIKFLDSDLKLGIFSEYMLSGEVYQEFVQKLNKELSGLSVKDRLDIGIAFLEMGLYDIAANQFQIAKRSEECRIVATSLLAYAFIKAEKSFEATQQLEPVLGDHEIDIKDKINLMYLMARACEEMQKLDNAYSWYEQVSKIDSYYRDVSHRMKQLQKTFL